MAELGNFDPVKVVIREALAAGGGYHMAPGGHLEPAGHCNVVDAAKLRKAVGKLPRGHLEPEVFDRFHDAVGRAFASGEVPAVQGVVPVAAPD